MVYLHENREEFTNAVNLAKEVRSVRAMTNICPSAQPDVNVPEMRKIFMWRLMYLTA